MARPRGPSRQALKARIEAVGAPRGAPLALLSALLSAESAPVERPSGGRLSEERVAVLRAVESASGEVMVGLARRALGGGAGFVPGGPAVPGAKQRAAQRTPNGGALGGMARGNAASWYPWGRETVSLRSRRSGAPRSRPPGRAGDRRLWLRGGLRRALPGDRGRGAAASVAHHPRRPVPGARPGRDGGGLSRRGAPVRPAVDPPQQDPLRRVELSGPRGRDGGDPPGRAEALHEGHQRPVRTLRRARAAPGLHEDGL